MNMYHLLFRFSSPISCLAMYWTKLIYFETDYIGMGIFGQTVFCLYSFDRFVNIGTIFMPLG